MDDEGVYGEPPSAVEIAALVAVLALAIGRFVANRARRTVVENAQEDPAHPKCRWIVEADACDFCKARGSFLYEPNKTIASSHAACKCHPDTVYGDIGGINGPDEKNGRVAGVSNEEHRHQSRIGNASEKSIDERLTDHARLQMEERGISIDDVIDADKNPLHRKPMKIDELGRPSYQQIGRNATIVVNPDTDEIPSVWPTGTKTRRRYERNGNRGIVDGADSPS